MQLFNLLLLISSLPSPQPVEDEIDGFYGSSSEEEQVDEEGEEEEEEEDVSTTIPSGERTAGTNRDIPGPSNSSRGPVRGGMGSLNLGPPGNLPKKRKGKYYGFFRSFFLFSGLGRGWIT